MKANHTKNTTLRKKWLQLPTFLSRIAVNSSNITTFIQMKANKKQRTQFYAQKCLKFPLSTGIKDHYKKPKHRDRPGGEQQRQQGRRGSWPVGVASRSTASGSQRRRAPPQRTSSRHRRHPHRSWRQSSRIHPLPSPP